MGQNIWLSCMVPTIQDSAKYCVLVKDDSLPFAAVAHGEKWTYQRDRAAIHRSFYTKKWFRGNNVTVLPWPSRSPNLNPIEKLWGVLARRIHGNGRYFNDTVEHFDAIVDHWPDINHSILQNLVGSMQRRCIAVLSMNEGHTSY